MATQFSVNDNLPWKKRFFTIWTGQAISLLGSQLVGFAIVWYLTIRTGSATVLAISSLVGIAPGVLLGPFIGPLIDRWDRRKTMLVADSVVAVATLALAGMFAMGEVEIWHIYLATFIRAIAGGFHGNAMGASTSLMVPVEHLPRTQGMNQMLNGGLNIIAAPLGALLYEAIDLHWIFMIDVFTAIVAIAPLFFFQIPQPDRSQSEVLVGTKASYWSDMGAGFRYMWGWKGIFVLAIMAAGLNFLLMPVGSLMPLLISEHFGGDAIQLGTYSSLFGIGVIVGGLILSVWGGFKRKIITSMIGIIGIGVGTLVQGFLSPEGFIFMLAAAFFIGLNLPITNGTIGAIMQANVAPDMQGRVFSLLGSLAGGMMPLGLAIAGPVSDLIGIQTWFKIAGLVCIIMGIVGFALPAVYNIEENNPNKHNFVPNSSGDKENQAGGVSPTTNPATQPAAPQE